MLPSVGNIVGRYVGTSSTSTEYVLFCDSGPDRNDSVQKMWRNQSHPSSLYQVCAMGRLRQTYPGDFTWRPRNRWRP